MEIVGQKHVVLAGIRISIADTSQRNWATGSLGTGKEDGLVAGQAFALEDIAAVDDAVTGIALLPGDKIVDPKIPKKRAMGKKGQDAAGSQEPNMEEVPEEATEPEKKKGPQPNKKKTKAGKGECEEEAAKKKRKAQRRVREVGNKKRNL